MFPLSFFISHGKSCQQYLTDDMGKGVGSRKGKEAIPRTDILSIPGGRQCIIKAHIPQLLVTSQDKQPNTLEYSLWGGGSHTPCDHLIIMGHHKCWCQSIRNVLYLGFFCYILNVWLLSRGYNKCLLDVSGCCDQSFVWFCNHRIDLRAEAGLNPWSYCPVGALGQHYQSWCPVSDSYSLLISFNKQDKIQLYIAQQGQVNTTNPGTNSLLLTAAVTARINSLMHQVVVLASVLPPLTLTCYHCSGVTVIII